jgi:hypothetical protein
MSRVCTVETRIQFLQGMPGMIHVSGVSERELALVFIKFVKIIIILLHPFSPSTRLGTEASRGGHGPFSSVFF